MKWGRGYVKQLQQSVREISRVVEISMFTGWVRGYFEQFSRCCSAPIYVRSLMEGIPYCERCNHVLLDSDIRREWIPPHKADEHSTAECPWPMEPQ